MIMRHRSGGFTVVELLVVIVIVALLAMATVVSYRGLQDRSKDSIRVQDAAMIVRALELYNARYGNFPNEQGSSWETSTTYPTTFLNELVASGTVNAVPVDRVNTSSGGYYRYYLYSAGSYGCDVSRGDIFILQIIKPGGGVSAQSPGFACPTRDWGTEAWYTVGGFRF